MKIIVLVKQVPDTDEERRLDLTSGVLDRGAGENVADEISERALEVALRYKDAHKETQVVVLSMGPGSVTKALRKSLSMGADSAIHVQDDALSGADAGWTAAVLAEAAKQAGFDLVVAGNESTDGRGGVVPAMIAEHLGLPHLSFLNAVDISENVISGERSTGERAPAARRRQENRRRGRRGRTARGFSHRRASGLREELTDDIHSGSD